MSLTTLSAPVTMLGATDMTLQERISYAGTVTLLGMLVIFSVLSIVWLAIVLMRTVLSRFEKEPAKKDLPAPSAPVSEAPSAVNQPATDDGAILAAITAAIAVVWESEHPNTGFRVVSYRHLDARKPWNTK